MILAHERVHLARGDAVALSEAAVAAVKSWSFNPARANGRPVAGKVLVPVEFFLSKPGATAGAKSEPGVLDAVFTTAESGG